MAKRVMKYNPAFLSQAELIDQFTVRHGDLQMVLQTIRENTTGSNQHVLLIGPRGSGKTMLVQRVAAEINRDPELRDRWYPLVFSEESYEVTTPGEFWLEATFHLAQQTMDPAWLAKYEEFGAKWRDEEALREKALGQLTAFADRENKRLLLIVENLNALIGDQISGDDAWKLRHTLQNEPRLMLLATATSRFEEIDKADKAMYELFGVHHLRPLDRDECRTVWQALAGQLLEGDRVRPIQILTGGNLRLLTILSTFGGQLSLRQLMDDLVRLVDEHTEYFKSHLDGLPPIERKVYLALAERWDPSTARGVAETARLEVSSASSLLRRLVDRGAVATLDGPGRTKWYQVSERMYNIYYLFRRRGSSARRVRAVVRFMISFYQPEQLIKAARHIANEIGELRSTERGDHYQVYSDLMIELPADSLRAKLIEVARDCLTNLEDVPDSLAQLIGQPKRVDEDPRAIQGKAGRGNEVALVHQEILVHVKESRFEEAARACREAIKIDPQYAWAWAQLGQLLHEKLSRPDEAEDAYREAIKIKPNVAWGWALLGQLLHQKLSRTEEAEEAYRKAIEIDPRAPIALEGLLSLLLSQPERRDEALLSAETAISQLPDDPRVLNQCAWQLYRTGEVSLITRALPWAEKAVVLDPGDGVYQHTLASIQCALGNLEDALVVADKYLADEETVGNTIDSATDLLVELAARGKGPDALRVLMDSPSREQLEPLAVGIRIFLGEEVKSAAEIKEIGLDVARCIERRRDELRDI